MLKKLFSIFHRIVLKPYRGVLSFGNWVIYAWIRFWLNRGFISVAWFWSEYFQSMIYDRYHNQRCLLNAQIIMPEASMQHIYRRNTIQVLLDANRKLAIAEGNTARALRYAERVIYRHATINDPNNLAEFIHKTPCMIALLHSGDHYVSVMLVARLLKDRGLSLVVVATPVNEQIKRAIERLNLVTGSPVLCLDLDPKSLATLLRRSRDPKSRILIFYDMPAQLGLSRYEALQSCRLFGKSAYVIDGPFRIAARAHLPIVFGFGEVSRHGYSLSLKSCLKDNYDMDMMLAAAIAHLEFVYQKNPELWMYLRSLEVFYQTPEYVFHAPIKRRQDQLKKLVDKLRANSMLE